jgi:hypothetical protein
LVATNRIDLLGSTFADHMPKYFPTAFNQTSKALGDRFLDTLYGGGSPAASRKVFWAPERVLDAATLAQVEAMGYEYVFADQMRHFLKWFGRSSALGTEGFRLNQVGNLKIFPLHDFTSEYLDQTLDEGSSLAVRQLLSRRARSGVQDQVTVLWRDLNDFSSGTRATSYDANVRWLASRPWVRIVTADQIANDEIQYPRQSDGQLTGSWGTIDRTGLASSTFRNVSKDWVDWASGENYDNWFTKLSDETFGLATPFGRAGDRRLRRERRLGRHPYQSGPARPVRPPRRHVPNRFPSSQHQPGHRPHQIQHRRIHLPRLPSQHGVGRFCPKQPVPGPLRQPLPARPDLGQYRHLHHPHQPGR